jgi:hypothetical protein
MFEPIEGLPGDVIALRAVGQVTGEDYAEVLVPAVDRATAEGRKVRLLIELGPSFDGLDPGAVLADAGVGIRDFNAFERLAVVTDSDWIRRGIHLFGPLIPGDVRVFGIEDGTAARTWISA